MNMNFVKVHTEDRKRKDKVKLFFTIITVEVSPSAKFDPVSGEPPSDSDYYYVPVFFPSHFITLHYITKIAFHIPAEHQVFCFGYGTDHGNTRSPPPLVWMMKAQNEQGVQLSGPYSDRFWSELCSPSITSSVVHMT
jgi:hypothetical protein